MRRTFVIGKGLDEKTAAYIREMSADLVVIAPVAAEHEPRWQNRAKNTGSEIGIGAAGCLLAHEKVWEMIATANPVSEGLFLVVEDDAVLTRFGQRWFPRVVEKSKRAQFDLVHLGRTKISAPNLFGGASRRGNRRLSEPVSRRLPPLFIRGFTWRTHAYLISSNMARYLLEQEFDFGKPVDQRLKELFGVATKIRRWKVHTCTQPLFLQADRESLVNRRGR